MFHFASDFTGTQKRTKAAALAGGPLLRHEPVRPSLSWRPEADSEIFPVQRARQPLPVDSKGDEVYLPTPDSVFLPLLM